MNNILVIAAHPDDEILGCGGTTARFAEEGHNISTLVLGEGVTSRDEKRDRTKREEELVELKEQMNRANKILGVKKVLSFNYPDNRFDTIALLNIVKTIEEVKKEVDPDIVFTHHWGDLNIDHRVTFEAVMTAFRPLQGESARALYSFEIPSSTEWNMPSSEKYFMPNYFVDISETLKQKISALKEYMNEMKAFPHPRSLEAVELNAKRWGVQVGVQKAEAFQLVRQII